MISHLSIRDFAIIKSIDIDVYPGLNVITGETGAGKSIIIEAVSLALGSRADTAMVRTGAGKALIQLVIDEAHLPAEQKTGLELLTREISAAGKSISRAGGEIVTLGQLTALAGRVADIHGQYDHQSLLNPDNHLDLIDAFGGDAIAPTRQATAACYEDYRKAKKAFDELTEAEAATMRELDFLRFEVKEIESADLRPGEYEELRASLDILQNSEKIQGDLADAYEALTGGVSALDGLGRAMTHLARIAAYSPSYQKLSEIISESYYNLEEAAVSLRDERDRIDFSEQRLTDAMSRLDQLERLISKYGGGKSGAIENVLEYLLKGQARLEDIENMDQRREMLAQTLKASEERLIAASEALSARRQAVAADLETEINGQLLALNFKDARFRVDFSGHRGFSAAGTDHPEFLMRANKGQPFLPIAKAASGGELSRIMLAFKAVTGAFDHIPTMIFDEIDTGISGVTASIVGEKLKQMAGHRQIICITHLPQIAAFADHHFILLKDSDDETTYTTIQEICGEERVVEIARLLGGKNVTPTTLESARELISLSSP